ncbi:cupin domain-containing protein [Burkholderia sp. WP9]|uniref:cupin domain-containing protein n=1 Tax=Burkholderia sp. WP9 TaxID=1500263 RepID=UPI001C433802
MGTSPKKACGKALPRRIHIRRADSAGLLKGIVHVLMIEADDIQPGAAWSASRLIDLVVIRTLQSWIQQGPASAWLGGLSDSRIANTLKAIHERPVQRWSTESLAVIAACLAPAFSSALPRWSAESGSVSVTNRRLRSAALIRRCSVTRLTAAGFACGDHATLPLPGSSSATASR